MSDFDTFNQLFDRICEIKKYVLKLNYKDLAIFKNNFYHQNFPEWKLNILWEFIWDDKDYAEICRILKK